MAIIYCDYVVRTTTNATRPQRGRCVRYVNAVQDLGAYGGDDLLRVVLCSDRDRHNPRMDSNGKPVNAEYV